jgi:hypothetical protein
LSRRRRPRRCAHSGRLLQDPLCSDAAWAFKRLPAPPRVMGSRLNSCCWKIAVPIRRLPSHSLFADMASEAYTGRRDRLLPAARCRVNPQGSPKLPHKTQRDDPSRSVKSRSVIAPSCESGPGPAEPPDRAGAHRWCSGWQRSQSVWTDFSKAFRRLMLAAISQAFAYVSAGSQSKVEVARP